VRELDVLLVEDRVGVVALVADVGRLGAEEEDEDELQLPCIAWISKHLHIGRDMEYSRHRRSGKGETATNTPTTETPARR